MEKKVRVRYAPSPTGPQHIGGIRTALYNYLFAKSCGGEVILRIEDTDQTRFVEGAEDYLLKSVEWCGFEFDEGVNKGGDYGPYRQSERKAIYLTFVQQLLDKGLAYYAFDTAEDLTQARKEHEALKQNWKYDYNTRMMMKNSLSLVPAETEEELAKGTAYTVRLKVPEDTNITVNDLVRGEVNFNTKEIDDKVIFKSDGLPTYHLANVVDDHLMKISHVIRGEEWLPSAPFHVLLYKMLGWENEMPAFAHLPLLLKPNGNGKLSKRDGDALGFPVFPMEWPIEQNDKKPGDVFKGFKEDGYLPEAFLNIIAFLGWNPGTEQELFTMDELIAAFTLERVVKSGAKFDPEKAKWYNQQYILQKSAAELSVLLKARLPEELSNSVSDDKLNSICELMKERVIFVPEIYTKGLYFFENPTSFDPKMVKKKWKEASKNIASDMADIFENAGNFVSAELELAFKTYVEEKELGFGVAMIALRLSITGLGGGPSLFDTAEVIGKEECVTRLRANSLLIESLKVSA
jgi:glutamyl-tRNA synthetase